MASEYWILETVSVGRKSRKPFYSVHCQSYAKERGKIVKKNYLGMDGHDPRRIEEVISCLFAPQGDTQVYGRIDAFLKGGIPSQSHAEALANLEDTCEKVSA